MDPHITLIERIKPGAGALVEAAFAHNAVLAWYTSLSRDNPGVFCLLRTRNALYGFLSFAGDCTEDAYYATLQEELAPHLLSGEADLRLLVNGRNPEAVKRLTALGFRAGPQHAWLRFPAGVSSSLAANVANLEERAYTENDLPAIARLLDRAHAPLRRLLGQPTRQAQADLPGLAERASDPEFRTYWQDGRLVAATLTGAGRLTDLVVDPDAQGAGIGSQVLASWLARHPEGAEAQAPLDNPAALRFLQRWGAEEFACAVEFAWAGAEPA